MSVVIDTAEQFLSTLANKTKSVSGQSTYLLENRLLASKELAKDYFGGDQSLMERVAAELLDSTKTPLIRNQRYGVKMSIYQGLNKNILKDILLSSHSSLLSDLIASKANLIFNHFELLDLFDDERMSDHVRIRFERCIRKNCKSLIIDVVKKIMKRVKVDEVISMIGHIPSGSQSTEVILSLLNELKITTINNGPLVRKHPEVAAAFIKQDLDKTMQSDSFGLLWNLLIDTFSTHYKLFQQLSKVRPDLAFSIVNQYLIQYAYKENLSLVGVQRYLFVKDKNFSNVFLNNCLTPKSKDLNILLTGLFKICSLNDVAAIVLKKIEVLNYSVSAESKTFISSFEMDRIKTMKKMDIVFEKVFSKLDKEKVIDWIYKNYQNDTEPPSFLKALPYEISSGVVSKMYEEKKKEGFKSPEEETQYFVYLNKVEDEESFYKFKGKCSNSNPTIRTRILKDLFLCSLLSGKRIQETFEFVAKRLENDVEVIPNFIADIFAGYNSIKNRVFIQYQKEESFREAFKALFENTSKKTDSIWYHNRTINDLFAILAYNEVLLKDLLQWTFSLSKLKGWEVLRQYDLILKPNTHKVVVDVCSDIVKTEVSVKGNLDIVESLLMLINRPEKHQHIKDLLEKVFTEWKDSFIKSGSRNLEEVLRVYLKSLDKSVVTEKVKKLIEYDASFLSSPVIQRHLLSRLSTVECDFIFKYLDNKVLSMTDLRNLSEFKTGTILSRPNSLITFLPTAIQQLRLQEYASSEITSRLLNTYKQLLIKCGRCEGPNIIDGGNRYWGGIIFCKSIIKLMRKILIEKEEMNNFVQFLDNEFLSKIEVGEEEEENETDKIKFNVDDLSVRCLASLVRIYSQNPVEHLNYVLEKINAENCLYYFSGIGRIAMFYKSEQFVKDYTQILIQKFDSIKEKTQQLPENFSLSIQKLLISRLMNYVDYLDFDNIPSVIADCLNHLWNTKPHKDVQVVILRTALKLIEYDVSGKSLKKLDSILNGAVTHEYKDIVITIANTFRSKNVQVMRDLFMLRLKTLEHSDPNIQTEAWTIISTLTTYSLFLKQVYSKDFNPVAIFRKYISDAVLTFNLKQGDTIADVAIKVLIKEIIDSDEDDEPCKVLVENIFTPLLTEEKYKELDEVTYNAEKAWDKPVKNRLINIAKTLSSEFASNFETISDKKKESVQRKLIQPLAELIKLHVKDRVPFTCLVVAVKTVWTSSQSIVENCIKTSALFFDDLKEPLKSVLLFKLATNLQIILLNAKSTEDLIEAASVILKNEDKSHSIEEEIVASGIIKRLELTDQTKPLLLLARKKDNDLIQLISN